MRILSVRLYVKRVHCDDFEPIFARSASAVIASEKSPINTKGKFREGKGEREGKGGF